MADNEAKVAEFVDLTGVPKKQAEEILKRYNWNKEEAVEAFFAGADDEDDDMEEDSSSPVKPAAPSGGASGSGKTGKASMLDVWDDERKKKTGKDGQYFYVGGEHSGEVVIGPDRGGQKPGDMVQRLFEAAKEHGAEPVSPDEDEGERQPKYKPFSGAGARLGATAEAPSAPSTRRPAEEPRSAQKQPKNYRLRMWEDGFSIDDGELRPYNTPESERFLNAITAGRIPEELVRNAGGAEVHVDLEDHRHEEFTPSPKPKVAVFSGEGHRLGSVVPPMSTDPVVVLPPKASATSEPAPSKKEDLQLEVDESQPITTIQVRLGDGSRLVIRANHTHTVAQIRDFIRRARPQLTRSPFVLLTMFPNRELTDDSLTLASAGLLNAAIVQRVAKA